MKTGKQIMKEIKNTNNKQQNNKNHTISILLDIIFGASKVFFWFTIGLVLLIIKIGTWFGSTLFTGAMDGISDNGIIHNPNGNYHDDYYDPRNPYGPNHPDNQDTYF